MYKSRDLYVNLQYRPIVAPEGQKDDTLMNMKTDNSKIYASDYTGDDSIPTFVAFAVEQYKHRKGISGEEAMAILSEAGVLEHLVEFYDVMHQHGAEWLVEEIEEMVSQNKK